MSLLTNYKKTVALVSDIFETGSLMCINTNHK